MISFALIDESRGVTGGDLHSMATALEVNARHCAEAWEIPPPTVELWTRKRALPADYWPMYFVDDSSDSPDTLAEHYVAAGRPSGRIYVENASGLNAGRNSVCEAAAHEIVETLVNPYLRHWRPMPRRPGVYVALENADPVQTYYTVEVDGIAWRVANFVTPAYFEYGTPPEVKKDYLGELSRPGEIGPEGYLILRRDGRIFYEFGAKRPAGKVGKPQGRTERIAALAGLPS